MAYWLLKTEPDCYNWTRLTEDKKTVWDGITNALALKYLRTMKKKDLALIYHTGKERATVGIAEIISEPYPDPTLGDERLAVVDLKPVKALKQPVTLDEMKADKAFAGWQMLKIGRLSVVPMPEAMWKRIGEISSNGRKP